MSDKISLLIKDLAQLRLELKEIKSDIRAEEKITDEEYLELDKALKDFKKQVKEYKEDYIRQLQEMADYKQLLELKVKKEEEIGEKREELFKQMAGLPKEFSSFEIEMNDDIAKVELFPMMRLFVNGKEEKQA